MRARVFDNLMSCIASAAILCCSGCGTMRMAASGIWVSSGKPFPISIDEKKGWGHYSHPIMVEYDADLIVVYYNTHGDVEVSRHITVDEHGQSLPEFASAGRGPAVSRDRGRTWAVARPMLRGDSKPLLSKNYGMKLTAPAFMSSVFYYPDGRRAAFYSLINVGKCPDFTNLCGVGSAIFRDAQCSWSSAEDVYFYYRGPDGEMPSEYLYPTMRGVVMPDGSLVTAAFWIHARKDTKSARRSVIVFRSTDGGRTFHQLSVVATDRDTPWANEGPGEPAIALMPNGDLLCIMRTGDSGLQGKSRTSMPMLEARSTDGGKSWKLRRMAIAGVMPKLMVLKDGRTVVMATGRPGNMLYISRDSGKTWPVELAITPANIQTSGYMDILETEPGKLLVVYDLYDSPLTTFWLWEPELANGIFGVFVSIKTRN